MSQVGTMHWQMIYPATDCTQIALSSNKSSRCEPYSINNPISSFTVAATPRAGLDVSNVDGSVQFFCMQGIAPSTQKSYQSSLSR